MIPVSDQWSVPTLVLQEDVLDDPVDIGGGGIGGSRKKRRGRPTRGNDERGDGGGAARVSFGGGDSVGAAGSGRSTPQLPPEGDDGGVKGGRATGDGDGDGEELSSEIANKGGAGDAVQLPEGFPAGLNPDFLPSMVRRDVLGTGWDEVLLLDLRFPNDMTLSQVKEVIVE